MSHVHATGRDLTADSAPFGTRLGIAVGSVLVILLVAVGVALGATRSAGEPDWKKALDTRSQALDRTYGLGKQARTLAATATPGWLIALTLRSEMLDKKYGLGTDARTAASVPAPGWLTALMARSDALDRAYGLDR
jgi:hypothetical protein